MGAISKQRRVRERSDEVDKGSCFTRGHEVCRGCAWPGADRPRGSLKGPDSSDPPPTTALTPWTPWTPCSLLLLLSRLSRLPRVCAGCVPRVDCVRGPRWAARHHAGRRPLGDPGQSQLLVHITAAARGTQTRARSGWLQHDWPPRPFSPVCEPATPCRTPRHFVLLYFPIFAYFFPLSAAAERHSSCKSWRR